MKIVVKSSIMWVVVSVKGFFWLLAVGCWLLAVDGYWIVGFLEEGWKSEARSLKCS